MRRISTFFKYTAKLSIVIIAFVCAFISSSQAQVFSTEKQVTKLQDSWRLNELNFDIYPNPTKGQRINIKAQGLKQEKASLILYNTIGSVVWRKEVEVKEDGVVEVQLNPQKHAFPKGLYFLSVTEQGQRTMQKIIIN